MLILQTGGLRLKKDGGAKYPGDHQVQSVESPLSCFGNSFVDVNDSTQSTPVSTHRVFDVNPRLAHHISDINPPFPATHRSIESAGRKAKGHYTAAECWWLVEVATGVGCKDFLQSVSISAMHIDDNNNNAPSLTRLCSQPQQGNQSWPPSGRIKTFSYWQMWPLVPIQGTTTRHLGCI